MLLLLSTLAFGGDRTFAFGRILIQDDDVLVGVAGDQYRVLLAEHGRAAGQPVLGAENLLFDKDETGNADLLVGAAVDVTCGGMPRQCEISARWEALDVVSDAVVYEVTTRAILAYTTDEEALGRALLKAAADRLFEREKFKALLQGAPVVDPPPTWTAPLPVARCTTAPGALPGAMPGALAASVLVRAGGRVGSGIVVSPDGFALTAAHVVDGAPGITVELRNGLELAATVVRVDTAQDVALLDVAGAGHACLPVATREVPIGSTLFAIGAPAARGLEFSVSRGIASAYRSVEGWRLLQTDAAINPGNSGGPLLSESGEVAGIVSFKLAAAGLEGLGFGVAADTVMDRLGVELGPTSAAEPMTLAGRRGRAAAADRLVDTGDPPLLGATAPVTAQPSLPRPPRVYWSKDEKAGFAGLIGASVGTAALAVGTWAAAQGADTGAEWSGLGLANGVAWSASGILGCTAALYGVHASQTSVRTTTP